MLCTSKVRVVKESAYMISDTRMHPILLTKELLFRLLQTEDLRIPLPCHLIEAVKALENDFST